MHVFLSPVFEASIHHTQVHISLVATDGMSEYKICEYDSTDSKYMKVSQMIGGFFSTMHPNRYAYNGFGCPEGNDQHMGSMGFKVPCK